MRVRFALRGAVNGRAVAVLLVAAGALTAAVSSACGGSSQSADDVVQKAFAAVNKQGVVFHAKGDDGGEVWIDVEKQEYRRLGSASAGKLVSVGQGWDTTSYDPNQNTVSTTNASPAPQQLPRINNPAAQWWSPLTALAYGQELRLIGKTTGDGKQVVAIEARSPVAQNGQFTGEYLVARVEMDPQTYMVVALETRVELPAGQTPDQSSARSASQAPVRIRYQVTEFVSRDTLPSDFFSATPVQAQIVTVAQKVQQIKAMGIDPYWLGERYDGAQAKFDLTSDALGVTVDTSKTEASIHYRLEVPGGASPLADTLIERLGKAEDQFDKPTIEAFAGDVPEYSQKGTVRGQPVTIYRSFLTPSDLPCPTGTSCPQTKVPLYYRVRFTVGKTAIQVETYARVDANGNDLNGYNNPNGIVALAEALTVAQ